MADKGTDKLQSGLSSRKVHYVFERPDSFETVEGGEHSVPRVLGESATAGGKGATESRGSAGGKAASGGNSGSAAAGAGEAPEPIKGGAGAAAATDASAAQEDDGLFGGLLKLCTKR